jgi:Ca2+/Na+ antiporter
MNKSHAATIIAVLGLNGYLFMRFVLPTLQVERLVFVAVFSLIALVVMLMYWRERKETVQKT